MGEYSRGDVLLASVALDARSAPKARPVVVTGVGEPGRIRVCPVSSKAPSDTPCLPLALDDFASGGLDLFSESYVMTSRTLTIRNSDVIGKRGRLTPEALAGIAGHGPAALPDGGWPVRKKPDRHCR